MKKAYYFDLDNTLFFNDEGRILPNKLKLLYELKKQYGNNLSLNEMRKISDMDFGGLESDKGKKIQKN